MQKSAQRQRYSQWTRGRGLHKDLYLKTMVCKLLSRGNHHHSQQKALEEVLTDVATYVPAEMRRLMFFTLSAFFFDNTALALCLCCKVSRRELK